MTITVEDTMLPLVVVTTGVTELEYARKNAREAIAKLRELEQHNLANDLYQSLAPFIGFL